jgi:HK97 family phage major capsid protein
MDLVEYKAFLAGMSVRKLKDYLYRLDLDSLTDDERRALKVFMAELKVRDVAFYLMVFGLLKTVAEAAAERTPAVKKLMSALNIVKPALKERGEKPFDLVFVTADDPCPECAAESGKIYGKTTDRIPELHPHCMCKLVKVFREEPEAVKAMDLKHMPGGAVRALRGADDGMVLEVLAAPFGGPERKDRLGQYLSARTDYMIDVGGKRPTLYLHGFSPRRRAMEIPPVLGIAEVIRIDHQGLWMKTELDNSELSRRTWEAAKRGEARASTGSIAHLERHNEATGEVTCWPIAELSVFDGGDDRIPVSDDAVVIPIRALFERHDLEFDERFEAGEDKNLSRSKRIVEDVEDEMDEKAVQRIVADTLKEIKADEAAQAEKEAALRAEIEKEMKEDPKYRATFNIGGKHSGPIEVTEEEAERGVTKESKEENEAFLWNLMHPTQAPRGMRVLEESEALEGGPMVPADMLNQIVEIKGERSVVSKCNIHRYQTDKLIFNFPTETAAMTALAAIAEEAAYVANEPAFATVPATLVKYGSMVTVTEELLDDQNLFQPYFVKAVANAWALAENLEFFTKLKATDTVGTHSATFTDAEIMAWFFAVTDPWAEGEVHIVCERATVAAMRALLIATPRAYGSFPEFGGGKYPSFMGVPLHTNTNWETIGAGDLTLTMSFINADAVGWVENKGLNIKVDPYGDSLNGRIRYFPRIRFDCEILQALGHVSYTDHA